MRPSLRSSRERLLDERLRGLGLAFLDQRAGHVQPAVGVLGLGLGDLLEGVLGALEVALQQQADAPVVPALAILLADRPAASSAPRPAASRRVRFGQGDDGQVGDPALILPETLAGMLAGSKTYSQAVVVGADELRRLARLRLAGIGELGVVVGELAVVELRREA